MYPSSIRAANISPETYVGKILIYFKDSLGNPVGWEERDEKDKVIATWPVNFKNECRFNPFSNEDSEWGVNEFGRKVRIVINAGDPEIDHLELMYPGGDKSGDPSYKSKRVAITLDQLKKLIEEKCIWTANNTLFLRHEVKWGVVSKWSEFFYNLRKQTKKKMLAIEHLLNNPEEVAKMTPEEKYKNETDMKNLDCSQISIK